MTQKRRNRYYRIASPLVARMLECIKAVAAIEVPQRHQPSSIADDRLRFARTCYDHLAGYLGVAIADALIAKGHIVLTDDGGEVTVTGMHFVSAFGAVLTPKPEAGASSAARASTGASAAITSPVTLARRSIVAAWRTAG